MALSCLLGDEHPKAVEQNGEASWSVSQLPESHQWKLGAT